MGWVMLPEAARIARRGCCEHCGWAAIIGEAEDYVKEKTNVQNPTERLHHRSSLRYQKKRNGRFGKPC